MCNVFISLHPLFVGRILIYSHQKRIKVEIPSGLLWIEEAKVGIDWWSIPAVFVSVQVDALRVTVKSDSEDDQYPVLFVVRQQKGVLSWQLPLIFHGL